MDLSFLSDSYTRQILHQLKRAQMQKTQTALKKRGFGDILSQKEEITRNISSDARELLSQLKEKYGGVSVRNVGTDQKSMDELGLGTAGTGNVVIAPDILEQMAKDPEKAAYYGNLYFVQSREAAKRRKEDWLDFYQHQMMADRMRSDLTGERGVLTDRGTDWLSAWMYGGGLL